MKRRKEASRQPWRHKMKASVSNLLYKTIQEFRSSGLCIDFNDVIISGIAGTGAFATVYKGTYENEEVAIKKLITQNSLPMSTKSLKDFASESLLLQQLNHPNIIRLTGICIEPLSIITEYCHRGNLFALLRQASKHQQALARANSGGKANHKLS